MATSSGFEGERLSTSTSILCESCNINPAIKYCAECPVHLCDICTRGHRNSKYTKHHVLSDIRASSNASSNVPKTHRGCHKHSNKKFTTCCTECVQLACDSCKIDHKGHELLPLTEDVRLYHKACSKNIQHLLDDLHELEDMKAVLEGHVTTYEDAIRVVDKWELDLLQMVKNKAAKLRKKLKELKDEKYKQLSDRVKGLMAQLQIIDQSITKLNRLRKSIDTQMLENELSASQEMIDKLESYKTELQPLPPTSKVENVLPNGDMMKEVDGVLDELFTEGDPQEAPNKGPKPVAEWKFTATAGGKDISQYGENPVKLTNVQYGPGPRGEQNGAVISGDQLIVVENPTDKLRFTKQMTFFMHVYLDEASIVPLFSSNSAGLLWLYPNTSSLRVDNTGFTVDAPNVLTPNKWHKITAVWNSSSVSIYVDGICVKSGSGSVDLKYTQNGQLYIGHGLGYFMKGRIAGVKIFNVALSGSDIKKL